MVDGKEFTEKLETAYKAITYHLAHPARGLAKGQAPRLEVGIENKKRRTNAC
jgi:hypothetical protein